MNDDWDREFETLSSPAILNESPTRELVVENRARLVELTQGYAGNAHVIGNQTVILGRAYDADITLDSNSISRAHARISRDVHGDWILEDLDSRNGTCVNNIPVTRHTLRFGDMLQLGRGSVLVFVRHDSFEEQLLEAQKLESVGRLAGGVAHDFNNMLGVILANAQYIMALAERGETVSSEDIIASVADQMEAAEHAAQLTQQLLRFARLGEGDHTLLDARELTDNVVSLCRRSLGPNIRIERELAEHPLTISGDNSQLSSALMNLLVNAGDAIGEAPGTITIAARSFLHDSSTALKLALLPFGHYVEIVVSDDGAGMSEETRTRVFEPFFTTKDDGGTGLGLPSAYGVVRRHGGDIRVESQLGVGTTFRLVLPFVDESKRPVGRMSQPTPAYGEWDLEQFVLVVDDEERVRIAVRRLLDLAGYSNVLLASDGEQAAQLFKKLHQQVNLVLLDMKMPGLDGAATFERLEAIDPNVSVLLISGNVDEAPSELRRKVRQVLPKPFTLSQLRTAMAACSRDD